MIKLLALLVATAAPGPPTEAQLAAYLEEHGKSPEDYVISKFAAHQVVFLGEFHRIRHDVELVQRLIPRLYKAGVRSLALEFAAEELQAEADRLVTADAYDPSLARSIMFRWSPIWGYHEYIELYRHAWQLNRSMPKGAPKFRIVHLGYRSDFSLLQGERTPEVMRKVFHRGDPDVFMAGVIKREFLDKDEKALVYCGRHHAFTRFQQPIYDRQNQRLIRKLGNRTGNLVYQQAPEKVFLIFLHAPVDALKSASDLLSPAGGVIDRLMANRFPGRSFGFDLVGAPFGDLPDPESYYSAGMEGFTLKDWGDGYIYTKPLDAYEGVAVEPNFITDANFAGAVAQLPNPAARASLASPKAYLEALAADADIQRNHFRRLRR